MVVATIGDPHGFRIVEKIEELLKTHDKVVVTGDYVDHWTRDAQEMMHNLIDLIQLKKKYPNRIVLILGNHDLPYYFLGDFNMYNLTMCTGHNIDAAVTLNIIYKDNIGLFQTAYQINDGENKYLWTHAGLSQHWMDTQYQYVKKRMYSDVEDDFPDMADRLNAAFFMRVSQLFIVPRSRGGWGSAAGGPFWADKTDTLYRSAENFHQIVGHSKVKDILTARINTYTSITYTDVLDTDFKYYSLIIGEENGTFDSSRVEE